MRKAWILIIALIVVGLLGMAALVAQNKRPAASNQDGETAAAEATRVVSTIPVEVANLQEEVEVTGTLKPADEAVVGPRIGGRITWIIGKSGTPVKRGAVVARLDSTDQAAQLRAARAAYQGATARLGQAKAAVAQQATSTVAGITNAEAAVRAAEARLEQAKAAVIQQATATDSGIATARAAVSAADARLKQAQTTADATEASANAQVKGAQATLDAARSRLNLLRNGARSQDRTMAENNVRMAKAAYDLDKAQYDRTKMLFDQGAVSKASLDIAETKMSASKTQYDNAQQSLSLVQEGARAEDIQTAEAAVRQAEEGLAAANAGTKQVDVAKANVDIARTGVDQAKAALDTALSGKQVDVMRDKDVLAAQAGVQQAKAALDTARSLKQVDVMRDKDVLAAQAGVYQAQEAMILAEQNLSYTKVLSPVDGVVADQIAKVGESVGSNADMLRISTNQSLFFEADISELEATRIRGGQPVNLSVDALQGDRTNFYNSGQQATISGSVEKVVPVVDARTRNFTVRIIVPRMPGLFPGMFARGVIVVARHTNALVIPKDAMRKQDDKYVVFVAQNGVARQRVILPGAANGTKIQIISGLSVGDQLIVEGQQNLLDNDKIEVRAAETKTQE